MSDQQEPEKKKRGRPAQGDRAMTNAERSARRRAKAKASQPVVLAKAEGRDGGYYKLRNDLYSIKEFIKSAVSMHVAMNACFKHPGDAEKMAILRKGIEYYSNNLGYSMAAMDSIVDAFEWPDDQETQWGVKNLRDWEAVEYLKSLVSE